VTSSAPPTVTFVPRWQVPTSAGPYDVELRPAPIGGWSELAIWGQSRTLAWDADELGETATAAVDGLGRPVTLEARRVVADFSSFLRGPSFRGAAIRSMVLGFVGLVLGIAVAIVWRLLELPGPFATVIAVGLTFAFASVPFRGANAVHTEYRLLLEGQPLDPMLVTQSGRSTKVVAATSTSLAEVSRATPPSWPSERALGQAAGAPSDAVIAHLITRKTDSGMLGVWSSELWLLPDGLLSVGTGLAGSVSQSMDPALPVVRRLTPAELDTMVATPRSERIPWTAMSGASVDIGLMMASLVVRYAGGRTRKFVWAKGTGDIDRLAAALAQALDGRFEDKRS
jgi:hypothetical protein